MSEHMGDLQEHRKPVEINTQLNASEKKLENEHIEDEIFKHDYKHEEELANANRQGQPNPQEKEDQKQQNLQVIVKKVNAHLPGPLPQTVKQKLSGKHSRQEKEA